MDLAEQIRQALRPFTTSKRPERLDAVADALDALAATLRARAAALRTDPQRPAAQRRGPRSPQAGPGAPPGDFVTVDFPIHDGRERVIVYVGRVVYYAWAEALQHPIERVDFRRDAHNVLWIDAVGRGQGLKLDGRAGQIPRVRCASRRDLLPQPGRYDAQVVGAALRIGARRDDAV